MVIFEETKANPIHDALDFDALPDISPEDSLTLFIKRK